MRSPRAPRYSAPGCRSRLSPLGRALAPAGSEQRRGFVGQAHPVRIGHARKTRQIARVQFRGLATQVRVHRMGAAEPGYRGAGRQGKFARRRGRGGERATLVCEGRFFLTAHGIGEIMRGCERAEGNHSENGAMPIPAIRLPLASAFSSGSHPDLLSHCSVSAIQVSPEMLYNPVKFSVNSR